ncbi:RtcB family protein [Sinimarinibacterium sp. NLF-5-8]|uniref:RtcB family protein n=1 Tax=Sinimarinibacterium sp. NLF-5-8 TaxID=2698684 RepID=UPI00137BD0C9|nr:RtcB family protein [Sinimarinibacterium sp. NLF-5-8]QHS09144.1 RtcB family protein [Sinimarinibacterium sp. NLF-5-8]
MPIAREINKGRVPIKIWTDDIESAAFEQLTAMSHLDIVHPHIAVMPDVHFGIGATVGSVIPTLRAIIPAAVGVDIGCGMCYARLSLRVEQLPDSLKAVREAIEDAVPVGFNQHAEAANTKALQPLVNGFNRVLELAPQIKSMMRNPESTMHLQCGTLGGGNHFIELVHDEQGNVGVMLHSGSRGIGNNIGRHFIELAKTEMERLDKRLPSRDLAYLREGTASYDDYCFAVDWAQQYARLNREIMMQLVLGALAKVLPPFVVTEEAVNCHHNYVSTEHHYGQHVHVTRKGAIRAGLGELGIIPGSMGTRSYIVRGKGNSESLCSCSHGAGRRLSRGKAKKVFTQADLEAQTQGVECRKDAGVLDEIPGAYKDIDVVMAQQSDLVEIVHTLKQLVCVKG